MKNLFNDIPDTIDDEIIDNLIDSKNVSIERIVSKGHQSPASGWYDQDKNEWVLIVKGAAVLRFADGSAINMKTGDYMNIPAHKKHKVEWTDPDTETVWLAVFY